MEWLPYRLNTSQDITNTIVFDTGNASGIPKSAPIRVEQNKRVDKCSLYVEHGVLVAFHEFQLSFRFGAVVFRFKPFIGEVKNDPVVTVA